MSNKKKIFLIITISVLLLALTACSNKNKSSEVSSNETTVILADEPSNETTVTLVEEPIEDDTDKNAKLGDNINYDIDIRDSSIDEDVIEDNNVQAKEYDFVQFDTYMYRIEDIALLTWDYNNNSLKYDINGDGNVEDITIRTIGKDKCGDAVYDVYKLFINGKEIGVLNFQHMYDYLDDNKILIVDINKDDDAIEVVHTYDWDDDLYYDVYSVQDSGIKELDEVFDGYTNQKGIITLGGSPWDCTQVSLHIYECYYYIENDTVQKVDFDVNDISDVFFTAEGYLFTTDLNNIERFMNSGYTFDEAGFEEAGIYTLKKNDMFTVVGFEGDCDIEVKMEDGTIGYILGNHWVD